MRKRTVILVIALLAAIACAALVARRLYGRSSSIQGVTLTKDSDPHRQVPIPGVEITASVGDQVVHARTDAAGAFHLTLAGGVWRRETVLLHFQHSGFETLDLSQPLSDQIYVIRMPAIGSSEPEAQSKPTTLKDVRLRYATQATTPINVGSIAKTFEVVNRGNVPCNRAAVCSPDGKWKAATGGITLDAGEGHEFRNVRTSCIAGPCPFTRTEPDQVLRDGRIIKVSVRDWSDTVTFLVEAEVIQTRLTDLIRNAYPAIFGREMSFTLPPTAEGPSIEADTDGTNIVYPLGPKLALSWADCNLQLGADQTKLYRCELKPGYRFQ